MELTFIDTIVYLLLNIFKIYLFSILINIFLKNDATMSIKVLRFLAYIAFYVINSASFLYWNWSPNLILISNLVGVFIITLTYTGKLRYGLLASVLNIALAVICEDTVYYLLLFASIKHIFIVAVVVSNILFFMIVLIIKRFASIKKNVDIPMAEWFGVFFIPLLSMFISALVLDKCTEETAVAIGEVCLVSINILIFFLLDRLQSAYKTKLDTQLLAKQNEAYDNQMLLINESEKRLTSLKHDLKNHFFSLKKLAEESDAAPLTNYIDKLISDTENVHTFAESGNFVVDSFLNLKLSKAKSLGADIKTDIAISTGIKIDDKDISIILGNLLDNAITALEKCEKEKMLNIYMRETSGKLVIKIENSHSEKIKKKGSSFASTKSSKSNHGIGLKNVKNVTESYDGILDISYTDDRFIVKVLLYI